MNQTRGSVGSISDTFFMDNPDWDDPALEERWCAARRNDVREYLAREGLRHGEIGSWPAWHVVPYVSLWAIESLKAPGNVGWWAICGDLPTDYLSSADAKHPRVALAAFADRWKEVAAKMLSGVAPQDVAFGPPGRESDFGAVLQERSEVLRRFADDDSCWGPQYD
jgi:hypothetical protein